MYIDCLLGLLARVSLISCRWDQSMLAGESTCYAGAVGAETVYHLSLIYLLTTGGRRTVGLCKYC
jgi:hypothetical protein